MQKVRKAGLMAFAFFALTCAGALTAQADPVVLTGGSTVDLSGTGFGTRLTILSLQQQGSGTTESGATTFASPQGTGDSTNQDSLLAVSSLNTLGINSLSNFGLVYNLNETGSSPGTSLVGSSLVLTFYDAGGGVVATGVIDPTLLDGSGNFVREPFNNGNGGSGYLFVVNPDGDGDYADINALLASGQGFVGLSAAINNVDDGADNFFVLRVNGNQPEPVPEPTTMLLLGVGLAGVAARVRSRRRAARPSPQ